LFIITNQPGISKGIVTAEQVNRVNSYIQSVLKAEGVELSGIYVCPHQESEGCRCRKPGTYFPEKTKKEYSLDLNSSFVIGDHPGDAELAIRAGLTSWATILILFL